MMFWHNRKIHYFDPYNVLLAIATNIPQRLTFTFMHLADAFIHGDLFFLSV